MYVANLGKKLAFAQLFEAKHNSKVFSLLDYCTSCTLGWCLKKLFTFVLSNLLRNSKVDECTNCNCNLFVDSLLDLHEKITFLNVDPHRWNQSGHLIFFYIKSMSYILQRVLFHTIQLWANFCKNLCLIWWIPIFDSSSVLYCSPCKYAHHQNTVIILLARPWSKKMQIPCMKKVGKSGAKLEFYAQLN